MSNRGAAGSASAVANASGLTLVGGAWEVADLLACFAGKAWLATSAG